MPETTYTIDLKIKDDGVTWTLFKRDEIGALKVVRTDTAVSVWWAVTDANDAICVDMKAVKP